MMKLRSEYTLNQDLRNLADTWNTSNKYDRPGINKIICEKLKSRFGAAITPSTREYIANIIGDKFTSISSEFYPYIPNEAEIGRTYLTVAGEDKKGQTISTAFFIQVKIRESEHQDVTNEVFNDFKDSFYKAAQSVKEYVDSFKNNQIYVSSKLADYLMFTITDRNGETPAVKLSGDSIELPFALAIYSTIIGKPVPVNYCATGQFDRHRVLPVSAVNTKLNSAICEFEEIDCFLYPPGDQPLIQAFANHEVVTTSVNTLSDALKICFSDHDISSFTTNDISSFAKNSPGIVTFTEHRINVFTESGTYSGIEIDFSTFPRYLIDVEYVISLDKLDLEKFKGISIIAFSNARASWQIGRLCAAFINICPNIVIYDPKFPKSRGTRSGLVITKATNVAPLKVGKIVEYEYPDA
ncbi:MAG: hypothetical protein AMXMBFR48_22670 [Ignavibacteriales bacterium]